jgi:hypothetical protein
MHMDVVFWLCAAHGYPLRNPRVLDPFAGAGINMSHAYVDRVGAADLWDLNADDARLASNLGTNVSAFQGDSFKALNEGDGRLGTYDLIVLDNNLGGIYDGYCEHFDAMPSVFRYLRTDVPYAVVAMNFITDPHLMNRDPRFQTPTFEEQLRRRARFYDLPEHEAPGGVRMTPKVGAAAYDREARKHGFCVEDFAVAPRAEFFHFLVLFLRPVDAPGASD